MSEARTYRLFNAQQAQASLQALYRELKPYLLAEHRFEVVVKPEKRSNAENALLHAMLSHVAKSLPWAGKKRDVETWKRLIVASWCRARGEPVELLPAVDGHGVDIVFRRTSELTRSECAELITYLDAWMADQGIPMPADPRQVAVLEHA